MNRMGTSLLLLLSLVGTAAGAVEPLAVENEFLRVMYAPGTASLSIRTKLSGKVFVTRCTLGDRSGTAKIDSVDDTNFGRGKEIALIHADGNREVIQVFARLPFVLFRSTLHNGDTKPTTVNHVRVLAADVELGKPPDDLRALGTGGLTTLPKNPGSYAFLAVADPATRAGVVGAWLTHDRGSGVVFSPVEGGKARITAQIDYGRLRIKPGQDAQTETFALGYFDDMRLGLEAYADAVAKVYAIRLPPQPAGYCTWYADKHAGACDEKHLPQLAAFAARELKSFGFDFVQIDDKWQAGVSKNGPSRNFTTHRSDGPYPHGMTAVAEQITKLGLTPGIWFMPFAGTHYDPFFKDHQDWFAKTVDGQPFETTWGGTCLDMTHPGAREHLRNLVQRIAHQWGYKLFKMDGLWTGTATRLMYVNDGYKDDHIGEALLHDPDKTHIEAYRDGLKLVRQVAGPDVFLLGCCVSQNMRSFGGAFGLVDAMRVGPDTGAGYIGAPHASRTWFLHGRVWQNDPDCVSVRAATPLDQARLNATFTAMAGHLFYNSDWMPDLPAERLDILKRTMAGHGLLPRPVDVLENEPARIWLLTDARREPRRDVVALYNWDQKRAATITSVADRIGLAPAKEYVAFDFWANRFVPPMGGKFNAELPPASCRVWAVRPVADHPQLLSTSRHLTQGMIDVLQETWTPAIQTLSGTSRVVAADPYELRIVVPTGEGSWLARDIGLSSNDLAAGVKAELKQDGPKLRATIISPTGREVRWLVKFERARIEIPAPAPVTGLTAGAEYTAVSLRWQDSGAERYRVLRSDGARFECTSASLSDTSVEHSRKYGYTVQSMGWDGAPSAAASVEVTTPAELKCPPTPPLPDVQLSSLKPLVLKNGYGTLGINKSIDGNRLALEGKHYTQGLGAHANALLVYAIPADARRFVTLVGLDDERRNDPRGSVTFEVYGDVKEMGEQPVLLDRSPVLSGKTIRTWAFNMELNARFKELRLVVTDAGDGIACDHADWVNAGFIRTPASVKAALPEKKP